MRTIILTLIVLLCTTFATPISAQRYTQDYVIERSHKSKPKVWGREMDIITGVMAGVSIPMLAEVDELVDVGSSLGWGAAMMWGLDLGSVEFVPEIWYRHSSSDIEASGDDYSLKNNTLEVPLLCALKMGCLRLNFGPSFSLLSSGQLERRDKSYEFGRVRSTVGYVVGLSAVLMEHVVLDVRYNGHFVPLDVAWYSGDEVYTYSYRSVGFNVGYRF